jgi:regulator of replication initiation timing
MAAEKKEKASAVDKEGKTERRRLSYLKARAKEVRAEMLAIRKESAELREKLGKGSKKESKPKATPAGKK